MRANQFTVLELHVPLGASPRFFVPPISRKQKRPVLIDDLSAYFIALEISLVGNEQRRVRRRPKPSQRYARLLCFRCRGGRVGRESPTKRLHPERVRPMRFF